jgi:uncharacterized membrane protein
MKDRIKAYWRKFSVVGLFIGVFFFAASLTPSLLPRNTLLQGLISGFVLAFGYGMGCLLVWLWKYLELPVAPQGEERKIRIILGVLSAFVIAFALGRSVVWQNSVLEIMGLPLVDSAHSLNVMFITVIVAVALIAIGRLIKKGFRIVMNKTYKLIPRRIANLAGFIIAFILLIFLLNGVVWQSLLGLYDKKAAADDLSTAPGVEKPADPNKTGSDASLVSWDTLGKQGRNFIVNGPTKEDISSFSGRKALEPIRVYVGMNSKESIPERAQLALDELKRVGSFDRSVLLIVTPTGTGWMDPHATDTVEYVQNGDIATVAVQYSYLQSPIALIVDPDLPRETAHELFRKVYDYWKTLPKLKRPKVYLNGVSLGTFGSEKSIETPEMMEDPIAGALWAGPPFVCEIWKDVTANRNPDSPVWLPTYKDGSLVRFTAKENALDDFGDHWGPIRIIYLEHSSDPIAFFSPRYLYRMPEWLKGERGPDISPMFHWYPGVTFFQLLVDLMVSMKTPIGYGHNYGPSSYIDSWIGLFDPPHWNAEKTTSLKEHFSQ